MKIQEQLTSVEISDKLKILLGERQMYIPSLFFREWTGAREEEIESFEKPEYYLDGVNCYSVAELLNILPASTSLLKRTDLDTNSIPRYYAETCKVYHRDIWDNNPANALAKLLIHLLLNNLI